MSEPAVDPASAFQLCADVVTESFEDETIAVNLGSGRYYSINPTGAEVLHLLTSGRELHTVVALLTERHAQVADRIGSSVTDYAHRLVTEGLIAPAEPAAATEPPFTTEPTDDAFAPTLVVFSDMQDLLVLDPIHDVDAVGWPVRGDGADR